MTSPQIPHFVINNRFQKRVELYSDILTDEILMDICNRVTGHLDYTVEFVNEKNDGRLITLEHNETINYISISEDRVQGRNSSFQSLPTALVRYYKNTSSSKRMFFYFLPAVGSYTSDYFKFMYRLMKTAGVDFLNAEEFLEYPIYPFNSIDDVIASKTQNRGRNSSNNSTYLTRSTSQEIEVYGKTYGANKKETTLLCIALSLITTEPIKLFVINEQGLKSLPKPDLEVIEQFGKIEVLPTNLVMERNALMENRNLRSPRFIFNLLAKVGPKKCTFCDCEIPELIQGAHVWPVADIKGDRTISMDNKVLHATDADNGLWLCENHHKMLDENLLTINLAGQVEYKESLDEKHKQFILNTTLYKDIPEVIYTEKFTEYLKKRYMIIS